MSSTTNGVAASERKPGRLRVNDGNAQNYERVQILLSAMRAAHPVRHAMERSRNQLPRLPATAGGAVTGTPSAADSGTDARNASYGWRLATKRARPQGVGSSTASAGGGGSWSECRVRSDEPPKDVPGGGDCGDFAVLYAVWHRGDCICGAGRFEVQRWRLPRRSKGRSQCQNVVPCGAY
jgi:hypothetical protein